MVKLKAIMTLLAFSVLAVDSAASLIACLNASNVPLISTSDADYAPAVIPYNLRLPFFPAAIAVPTTAAHVSSALKCAQTFNTKVAARSGGHSYAAFGLGGVDGSLMIDMKKFRNLTVDPDTFVATVGAGLRLGDIASGIHAIAGRALPHGLCPGVGISGHALHGGFGFTSRMWGTTLGTIIEMEVVLASGEIVNVSKESNPDLFWALRGAGSSFGIVTTFKLKTYPAPASGINFTWTWTLDNNATATVDTKVKLFQAVQDYSITTAPSNMALRVFTVPMMSLFQITGVFWGSREDFDSVIAPLVDSFPDQDNIPTPEVLEHAYLDLLVVLALGQALPQPENYTMHDTFFTKSIVAPSPLTTNALTSFFTFHGQNANKPPLLWFVIADLYGGKYSAISAQDPADSSYYVRDSLFTFQLYSNLDTTTDPPVTTYPPWGIEFMDGLSKSMTDAQTETKFHAYPNYADPTLPPQLAHELYYGENYPRLASLKGVFDPGFLLWNPQAVGTS